MPKILTIDDSSTIRSIISKSLCELGFEIEQAEDGQQGLTKLAGVDLILLDVTMPVMDGPTMLEKLRGAGNKTPVIMLTSETKRSIMTGALKLGVEDYILKPFKAEELVAKVLKALKLPLPWPAPVAVVAVAPVAAVATSADVLVIDDMEGVHKKLRSILPTTVTMKGCVDPREAVELCERGVFRAIVIDLVIPEVNSVALMNQIRVLQPHAVITALALRSANDIATEAKAQGFHDVMLKPFDAALVEEWRGRHFVGAA
jgi:two-component system, cell cycle response regulator